MTLGGQPVAALGRYIPRDMRTAHRSKPHSPSVSCFALSELLETIKILRKKLQKYQRFINIPCDCMCWRGRFIFVQISHRVPGKGVRTLWACPVMRLACRRVKRGRGRSQKWGGINKRICRCIYLFRTPMHLHYILCTRLSALTYLKGSAFRLGHFKWGPAINCWSILMFLYYTTKRQWHSIGG
jgi:hypothetical protein